MKKWAADFSGRIRLNAPADLRLEGALSSPSTRRRAMDFRAHTMRSSTAIVEAHVAQ